MTNTEQPFSAADRQYMARAIKLASRGLYRTHPNPRVGCVLVKQGDVIAEGYHQQAGQAHAEINALNQAGEAAQGATAYVSLEPCSHFGKTPPCADALIKAGIARMVCAMQDPNPQVSGRGLKRLLDAGITVSCGLMAEQAAALNPGFIKRMQTGLPWVWLKSAMSVDGRTAMASGESQWITGAAARQDVQRLRARVEAILTGVETVIKDDPALTVRPEQWPLSDSQRSQWPEDFQPIQPLRVILDSRLRTPPTAKLLKLPGETWIFAAQQDLPKQQRLEAAGAKVLYLPDNQQPQRVDLGAVLRHLGDAEVNELLIESGAITAGAFVQQQWVDEWWLYMAPCLLGSEARPLLQLDHIHRMSQKRAMQLRDIRHIGDDIRFRYRFSATAA